MHTLYSQGKAHKGTGERVIVIIKILKCGRAHLQVISTELQANVSQDLFDIFPRFPQTAQVIDRELEHSVHLKRKCTYSMNNMCLVEFGQLSVN